jgi:SAM-dependent methyltransferase
LSDVAIDQAARRAAAEGLPDATFRVMNAEDLAFPDGNFDVICGSAILHHLDLRKAFAELARTLKADGKAVFVEPLGYNPLINLYRTLTPRMRTEDEHPLRAGDVALARRFFGRVETRFFTLQTLLAVPFRKTPLFGPMRKSLEAMDQALFRLVPPAGWLAWQFVLTLSMPRR